MVASKRSVPDGLRRGLRNFWYPILLSSELPATTPVGITRLSEPLVVWRDETGAPHVFTDQCPHRGAKLSIGDVVGGRLQCRYHGLQYDGAGQCRLVPAEQREDGRQARRLSVHSYPVEERAGFVWAYLGDVELFPPPPLEIAPELTDPSYASAIASTVWEANWLIAHDNTADPTHVPFLHGHLMAKLGESGLYLEALPGGTPLITPENALDIVIEPLVAETTEVTNFVRVANVPDDHPRPLGEVAFELPCLVKVWIPLVIGGNPLRLLQYQLPVDDRQTIVLWWAGRRCEPEEHEATAQLVTELFVPVNTQVITEDSWLTATQPEVEEAWATERLLSYDVGLPRVRKIIRDEYERQQLRGARDESSAGRSPSTLADSHMRDARN